MLRHFDKVFRPTARKQPGYVDLKILKLKPAIENSPTDKNFNILVYNEY